MKISILPIDVGFDLRALGIPVFLAIHDDVEGIIFKDKHGETQEVCGSFDEMRLVLESNGFKVFPA